MSKKFIFWWEFVLANQIRLLQNFALLLQNFALLLQIFALLLQIFALLLQIFALLLQIFALLSLLFGINCTEIDQSHSSIISIYIINQVKYTKSLGVFLDCNLSWNIHIDKLCKKIASGIGALKRIRPFVPYYTLLSIYKSLLQPHFDYCSVVWGNCSKTLSSKLQKLQNRAARILTYSSFDANADTLIEKLGWKKVNSQRQMHKAIMVYKSLNGLAPQYLRDKFVHRNNISNYSLRDAENKLAIPLPRTNYMRNSFSYSGAVLSNSLPAEMRQADDLSTFRFDCKNYPNWK